jgi:hypothetical protein
MMTKTGTDQNLSSVKRPQAAANTSSLPMGTIVLLVVVTAIGLIYYRYFSSRDSVPYRLSRAINDDLNSMIRANGVPPNFAKIRGFQITSEGSTFKPWADEVKIRIPTEKDGTHGLEVFIFFYIDDKKFGANVQYNLVEIKTNNTEWELTRGYELGWIL